MDFDLLRRRPRRRHPPPPLRPPLPSFEPFQPALSWLLWIPLALMALLARPLWQRWSDTLPILTPSGSRLFSKRPWWTTILAFSTLSSTVSLVKAQTSPGNETLPPSDARISYTPPLGDWTAGTALARVPYYRVQELTSGTSGQAFTIANVNLTFRGSALYYSTPLFPVDIGVLVSIDGSTPYRLPLFDNFTAAPPDGTDDTGAAPSTIHTFTLADNLDVEREHVVQFTSDTNDRSFFMVIGQFMLTRPPPGSNPSPSPTTSTDVDVTDTTLPTYTPVNSAPNFKVILPLAIVLPLVFIIVLTAGFCLYQRRARSRIAPSSSYLQQLNSQGTNRSRGTTTKTTFQSARRGTEESTGKASEAEGEELGEYTVPATAFLSDRKSPPMPYQDLSPATAPHPYTTGYSTRQSLDTGNSYARSAASHGTAGNDMAPLVPAKLTQANLSQLSSAPSSVSSHPSNGGTKPVPFSVFGTPNRKSTRKGDQQSMVSAANTAELLAQDIPYAPYLHTLAASSEGRGSQNDHNSRSVSRADQALGNIQEQEGSDQRGGFFGAHLPSRFGAASNSKKSSLDPFSTSASSSGHTGLYPTYMGQADPTAQLVASGAPSDLGDNSSLVKLKPNRRRRSGDANGSEAGSDSRGHEASNNPWAAKGLGQSDHSGLPPGAAAPYNPGSQTPPSSPPKTSNLTSKGSLRRKAVPTMQELERREGSDGHKTNSSGESLDLQIQPRTSPTQLASVPGPRSPQDRPYGGEPAPIQGLRPLPPRPRPLPPAPASTEGSAHTGQLSPPPSSYHATAGHHTGVAGGQPRTQGSGYDPVWYPDRVPGGGSGQDGLY